MENLPCPQCQKESIKADIPHWKCVNEACETIFLRSYTSGVCEKCEERTFHVRNGTPYCRTCDLFAGKEQRDACCKHSHTLDDLVFKTSKWGIRASCRKCDISAAGDYYIDKPEPVTCPKCKATTTEWGVHSQWACDCGNSFSTNTTRFADTLIAGCDCPQCHGAGTLKKTRHSHKLRPILECANCRYDIQNAELPKSLEYWETPFIRGDGAGARHGPCGEVTYLVQNAMSDGYSNWLCLKCKEVFRHVITPSKPKERRKMRCPECASTDLFKKGNILLCAECYTESNTEGVIINKAQKEPPTSVTRSLRQFAVEQFSKLSETNPALLAIGGVVAGGMLAQLSGKVNFKSLAAKLFSMVLEGKTEVRLLIGEVADALQEGLNAPEQVEGEKNAEQDNE